jgi:hypothetical protein
VFFGTGSIVAAAGRRTSRICEEYGSGDIGIEDAVGRLLQGPTRGRGGGNRKVGKFKKNTSDGFVGVTAV